MPTRGQDRVTVDVAFAIVPEWLLDSAVSSEAVRLFAILHRYADAAGECFPKRKTLADRLGCSVRSVDRYVFELVAVDALLVEPRYNAEGDRDSNLYTLRMMGGVTADATPGKPLPEGEVTADQTVGSGVAEQERKPGNESQGTRTAAAAAAAKEITDAWWLWHKEQTGAAPLQPYVSVRSIVRRCLEAGCTDKAVRAALADLTREKRTVSYATMTAHLPAYVPVNRPDEAYEVAL